LKCKWIDEKAAADNKKADDEKKKAKAAADKKKAGDDQKKAEPGHCQRKDPANLFHKDAKCDGMGKLECQKNSLKCKWIDASGE